MAEALDVAIAGGGPVGSALALALRGGPHVAAVFEPGPREPAPAALRPVALAHGSRLILERLGVWSGLSGATPIQRIHVSQRGDFGCLTLTADEAGLPALGYVADYGELSRTLSAAAAAACEYCEGIRVESLAAEGGCIQIAFEGGAEAVRARMAVVADGGALDGVAQVSRTDYAQTAIAALVETEEPHRNTAYERFTPDGPLALLPCGDGHALVWTVSADRAAELVAAPENTFLKELQRAFGARLGRFARPRERAAFPLVLRRAAAARLPRVALIGNAAQTLHPVAGQGFNLGLRDAWELAAILRATPAAELGGEAMLDRFRARRRIDRAGAIGFTHGLVRVFSNSVRPLALARGAGLSLLGCLPPVKQFVARRMIFGARG